MDAHSLVQWSRVSQRLAVVEDVACPDTARVVDVAADSWFPEDASGEPEPSHLAREPLKLIESFQTRDGDDLVLFAAHAHSEHRPARPDRGCAPQGLFNGFQSRHVFRMGKRSHLVNVKGAVRGVARCRPSAAQKLRDGYDSSLYGAWGLS